MPDRTFAVDDRFEAIGTTWTIRTPAGLGREVLSVVLDRIEEFDRAYSRFRQDSLVRALADRGGTIEFPADAGALLAFYRRLYDLTGGAVSPLVGGALEHLGYDAGYRLRRQPGSATVPTWEENLQVSGSVVTADRGAVLDFGAAGKGYLADIVSELLLAAGLPDHLVDAGGDLVHRGGSPDRIGLEHPDDPTKVVGVAVLGNGALCGSATNRRAWGEGLHHVVDPATGEPTTGVRATWVAADSAMVADGLSTALFFTEPAVLARDFAFSYVRMPSTAGIEYSNNFDGELFT